MKRDEAIVILGNHWYYDQNHTIYEYMGPASPENFAWEAPTLSMMLFKAASLKLSRLEKDILVINCFLKNNKLLIWRAKHKLISNWKNINEYVANQCAKLTEKQEIVRKLNSGEAYFEIIRQPEEMRVPYLLNIGTPLWHVAYDWPLTQSIKIVKYQVTKRTIYNFDLSKNNEWDVSPTYVFECNDEDAKTYKGISLEYPYADFNHVFERYQYRAFLNLEDAKAYALTLLLNLQTKVQADLQIIKNMVE